ncbi:hypothetical protein LY76DRAFT_166549 [Colletotrichum caudatum]|nr:hypothetical protein LY76DRAFT_166549 [Colletotrichum caudatum]
MTNSLSGIDIRHIAGCEYIDSLAYTYCAHTYIHNATRRNARIDSKTPSPRPTRSDLIPLFSSSALSLHQGKLCECHRRTSPPVRGNPCLSWHHLPPLHATPPSFSSDTYIHPNSIAFDDTIPGGPVLSFGIGLRWLLRSHRLVQSSQIDGLASLA